MLKKRNPIDARKLSEDNFSVQSNFSQPNISKQNSNLANILDRTLELNNSGVDINQQFDMDTGLEDLNPSPLDHNILSGLNDGGGRDFNPLSRFDSNNMGPSPLVLSSQNSMMKSPTISNKGFEPVGDVGMSDFLSMKRLDSVNSLEELSNALKKGGNK